VITGENEYNSRQFVCRSHIDKRMKMNSLLFVTTVILVVLVHVSICQTTKAVLVCSSNEAQCGSTCYLTTTHICIWDLVCRKGEGRCINVCYNLTTHKCIWGLICLKAEAWCANKCFNPAIEQCRQGKLIDINKKNT
jgi:hypothetical protein